MKSEGGATWQIALRHTPILVHFGRVALGPTHTNIDMYHIFEILGVILESLPIHSQSFITIAATVLSNLANQVTYSYKHRQPYTTPRRTSLGEVLTVYSEPVERLLTCLDLFP